MQSCHLDSLMNENSPVTITYSVLYTADKQKKSKKWHDGTLKKCSIAGGNTVFKLFGTRPCDIDDDPWDYEAGKEKRGYRVTPFVETLKVNEVEVGQQIQTARHLITVESLFNEGDDSDEDAVPAKRMKVYAAPLWMSKHRPASTNESENVQYENYSILYCPSNASKDKAWLNGSLKYDHTKSRAYFYTAQNILLLQKEMNVDEVKGGVVFESTRNVIQICEHLSAPVGESSDKNDLTGQWYEMIYTVDKAKKAKKWIDGFLEWKDDQLGKFWTLDKKVLLHKQHLTKVSQEQQVITGRHIFEIGCAAGVSTRVPFKSENITSPSENSAIGSRQMLPKPTHKASNMPTVKLDLTQKESSQQSGESILQPRSLTDLVSLLPSTSI